MHCNLYPINGPKTDRLYPSAPLENIDSENS